MQIAPRVVLQVRAMYSLVKSAISHDERHYSLQRCRVHVEPGEKGVGNIEYHRSWNMELVHWLLDCQNRKLFLYPMCYIQRCYASSQMTGWDVHARMAKAWPLYLYFGNLTKYAHSAPKSSACHLVGFLPSVSSPIILVRVFVQ